MMVKKEDARPDRDYENEMLRKQFSSSRDYEDDEEDFQDDHNKRKVMEFYLGMMRREVVMGEALGLSLHEESD